MRPDLVVNGTATAIDGPLLFLRRNINVGLNEAVEVLSPNAAPKLGRVAALDTDSMVIEILAATAGLGLSDVRVRFLGAPLELAVGPGLLGRVFNGIGEPADGGPPTAASKRLRVDGLAVNPALRELPRDFIETGITAIDLMNSLVRGQKLPLFSGGGLPHDRIVADIAKNARLRGDAETSFALVFAGIGISQETAETFRSTMEESGALAHTAMFLNLASESSAQRLLTPRVALTAAEYLASEGGRHVLVILTDMTNYCEALREVSSSRGEIPARKGYPGYMYSDLASIYERAGCIRGVSGTVTQLPILTMPADDISHPVPDLTGYITEGQIVLDRGLDHRGIFPPINPLPSLSRLMSQGIGKEFTHPDHPSLAAQLYASYAKAMRVRVLASVVGQEGLTPLDLQFLAFADQFEMHLIAQGRRRTLEESMEIGWAMLQGLPRSEFSRLSDAQVARYISPVVERIAGAAHA